jgi:uncharacterized protein YndB with AHSA1/START domain
MSQAPMWIEKAIVIDRAPEEIWAFVADPRNDDRWCPKVVSVEQVTGDGPGPQTSYRVMHRPIRLRKPRELAVTIEEFEPPQRMRIREEDDDAVFDVTYELHPTKDGTRLTQRDQIAWKIPKLQLPIARRMVSRDIQNQLAALKRLLEAE